MSQSRVRKAPGGSEGNKTRASVVKASGDSATGNRFKEQNQRSTSKNKLPKRIRYELENALVGLCDVWFEDIKPHLVRNNIKLHVEGPASGDHCLPAGAPGCSHDDPGAASDLYRRECVNFAACCSTRQTASGALCRRPPAPLPPPGPPLRPPSSRPTHLTHDSTNQKNKDITQAKNQFCKSDQKPPKPYWDEKIYRLCQTQLSPTKNTTRRSDMKRFDLPTPSRNLPREGNSFQITTNVAHSSVKIQDKPSQTLILSTRVKRKKQISQDSGLKAKDCNLALTVTPLASPNQATSLTNKPVAPQKYRPKLPQKTCIPREGRTSKTHILPLNSQYRTKSSEDKSLRVKLQPKVNDLHRSAPSDRNSLQNKRTLHRKPLNGPTALVHNKVSTNGPRIPNKHSVPTNKPISSPNESISSSISQSRITSSNKQTFSQKRLISSQQQSKSPSYAAKSSSLQKSSSSSSQNSLLFGQMLFHDRDKPSKAKSPSFPHDQFINRHTYQASRVPLVTPLVTPSVINHKSPPIRADFGKSAATTSFLHPIEKKKKRASRSLKRKDKGLEQTADNFGIPTLFDSELINIIANKNDRRLKVLFLSPQRDEPSSTIVNINSPEENQSRINSSGIKNKPWR